ncbi:hypothetical protein [Metabacillus sediminilitoris]|uniref:hypothetical protein n=1 Tax=Metabacillus sediminilitoris TaxID=2567941 RepID=UPI001454DFFF|nr:hypothetical protein [Metabacillus sediminilitoris]
MIEGGQKRRSHQTYVTARLHKKPKYYLIKDRQKRASTSTIKMAIAKLLERY